MSYTVQLSEEVLLFLDMLDEKSRRICINNMKKLASPYPGRGSGDKEKLVIRGEEMYRLHIGRSFTAFYVVVETQKVVRVIELLTIEQAHKQYGFK